MKIRLKKIAKFVISRLKEKSTYVGVAALAVAVGAPQVAEDIIKYGDIGLLILGSGLLTIDTTSTIPVE